VILVLFPILCPQLCLNFYPPLALQGILIQLDEQIVALAWNVLFSEGLQNLLLKEFVRVGFLLGQHVAIGADRLEQLERPFHVASSTAA
jgi:hypothetical protein